MEVQFIDNQLWFKVSKQYYIAIKIVNNIEVHCHLRVVYEYRPCVLWVFIFRYSNIFSVCNKPLARHVCIAFQFVLVVALFDFKLHYFNV